MEIGRHENLRIMFCTSYKRGRLKLRSSDCHPWIPVEPLYVTNDANDGQVWTYARTKHSWACYRYPILTQKVISPLDSGLLVDWKLQLPPP
jgi:hypothetical protein